MGVQIERYASRPAQAAGLAAEVAARLATALATRDHATLAVPGGTTPGPFLQALAADTGVDWARVRVMLTDERFVAETSDRSNTRLLRQTLLQGPAAAATLVPLYAAAAAPEDVLDTLSAGIAAALPLDVCVLGMGADMHTASLFPGADLLHDALAEDAPILLPMRAPGAPEPRLTLSAPVLRAARSLHLLITGPEKLTALDAARQEGPVPEAPVRAIFSAPAGLRVHYAD